MKVLIAIDSFKGSLSSKKLGMAIQEGLKKVYSKATIDIVPIADGGEGTVETLVEGLGGELIECTVKGPLWNNVTAQYGILEKEGIGVIEMASAAGLPLVPSGKLNPLNTTTYGVGELIDNAMNKGIRNFIIGIGGSATNDGGIGMMSALGYKFFDKHSNILEPVGKSLIDIAFIDTSSINHLLKHCKFMVACDVENPFYGKNGASYVYASQKGADKKQIKILDDGLKNLANIIFKQIGLDISSIPGSGAAGGLGGAFKAFLNGELKPGIDIIFEMLQLETKLCDKDVIITGEGKIDFQSIMGKAPIGVAKLGKKYNIPVIALAGSITDDAYKIHDYGITSLFSIINKPITLEDAMDGKKTYNAVSQNTEEIFRLIKGFNS